MPEIAAIIDTMKKPLVYDSPIVELHQRLWQLMLKVEDLRRGGRAFYEFVERQGQPSVEIKIYTSKSEFKTFTVMLPTTESDFDRIDRQITKLIDAIRFEEQRRADQDREALLKSLTPEQLKLLDLTKKEYRYEG